MIIFCQIAKGIAIDKGCQLLRRLLVFGKVHLLTASMHRGNRRFFSALDWGHRLRYRWWLRMLRGQKCRIKRDQITVL